MPSTRQHSGDRYPVVICGGGAAGMSAALSAAQYGAPVLLLECSPSVGGTVAQALIHTLAGFYDTSGELINGGLSAELVDRLTQSNPTAQRRQMGRLWVLNVCPQDYLYTVRRWLMESRQISVRCRTALTGVRTVDGRIVEATVQTPEGCRQLFPRAVIDATGTAAVVRLLDKSLVIDDECRAAGGWIFRLRGIAPGSLDFPQGIAVVRAMREAAAAGSLPIGCGKSWIDRGIYADEAFVKLFVPLRSDWQKHAGQLSAGLRRTQDTLLKFLRTLPGFAAATVTQTGALGVRDGGRIRGRYTLSVDDVRAGREFSDAVARCSWPIEYWDPEQGVSIEYLPEGTQYEVPMRSLRLPGIRNLWTVGKCLSADRLAHASARVVGACWAMGEAAGKAAASCRPSHVVAGGAL